MDNFTLTKHALFLGFGKTKEKTQPCTHSKFKVPLLLKARTSQYINTLTGILCLVTAAKL